MLHICGVMEKSYVNTVWFYTRSRSLSKYSLHDTVLLVSEDTEMSDKLSKE